MQSGYCSFLSRFAMSKCTTSTCSMKIYVYWYWIRWHYTLYRTHQYSESFQYETLQTIENRDRTFIKMKHTCHNESSEALWRSVSGWLTSLSRKRCIHTFGCCHNICTSIGKKCAVRDEPRCSVPCFTCEQEEMTSVLTAAASLPLLWTYLLHTCKYAQYLNQKWCRTAALAELTIWRLALKCTKPCCVRLWHIKTDARSSGIPDWPQQYTNFCNSAKCVLHPVSSRSCCVCFTSLSVSSSSWGHHAC